MWVGIPGRDGFWHGSRLEWSVHHSIVEIRDHEGDAEAKFVVANPPDVRTFLRVQELLQGLQHETRYVVGRSGRGLQSAGKP